MIYLEGFKQHFENKKQEKFREIFHEIVQIQLRLRLTTKDFCQEIGITENAFQQWRSYKGQPNADTAKRLAELAGEDASLFHIELTAFKYNLQYEYEEWQKGKGLVTVHGEIVN